MQIVKHQSDAAPEQDGIFAADMGGYRSVNSSSYLMGAALPMMKQRDGPMYIRQWHSCACANTHTLHVWSQLEESVCETCCWRELKMQML